jgi:Cu(I)/Ag(I) efflux system membrane fusion protein
MKYTKYLILFIVFMSLAACGSDSESVDQTTPDSTEPAADAVVEAQYDAPGAFLERLEEATEQYLLLSNALIEDDSQGAVRFSEMMRETLFEADSDLLGEEALEFWSEQWAIINTRALALEQETELEAQRYEFEFLSEAMIRLIDGFDPLSFDVYVQRCPMVRDGSADWLSRDEAILNPYHGDSMLTCGSVVRQL